MPGSKHDDPVLKESRTEYFLYVPYALRYRARRIEGRRWDSARKCWVLPKTSRVLQDLQVEFGERLVAQAKGARVTAEHSRSALRWRYSARTWIHLAVALAAVLIIWALVTS